MSWGNLTHLPDRVFNMIRRGYLLAVYNDGLLLKARVRTGVAVENDKLDVLHPAGIVSHPKPDAHCEVFTMDVSGDASRRVVLSIIGDRANHPAPDEGETIIYAPNDKKKFISIKSSNGATGHAARSSGRQDGVHIAVDDQPFSINTQKEVSIDAQEGIALTSENGITLHAPTVTIVGDLVINGALRVTGVVTAAGFVQG